MSDVGRHPADIEAAVYFCSIEALQNAAKYAGHEAVVHVALRRVGDREIEFHVSDDGAGFDPATATRGNGFVNMRDRLGAFGGSVQVDSAPGSGTRVTGRLPVQPEATSSC